MLNGSANILYTGRFQRRLGLVGQEAQHRLRRPRLELELGVARTHPAQVARERVREQVLAGAVQAQPLGERCRLLEDVPGEGVDRLGVDAVSMGHDQVQVVAAGRHLGVDEQVADDLGDGAAGDAEHLRMHAGWPTNPPVSALMMLSVSMRITS